MRGTIQLLYRAGVPALFLGEPGTGKTATIEAFARSIGAELICPHVRAPEDVVVAVNQADGPELRPIGQFRRALELANSGRDVIVFIDELTTLRPSLQAAVLRFLDSGLLGDERLPAHVWRCAAANPVEQAAGGWDLAAPTANRLVHVPWRVDAAEWARGFTSYWGSPPRLGRLTEEEWAPARALVATYLVARPSQLLSVPRDEAAQGRAWPSPRTWDFASRLLAAAGCDVSHSALDLAGAVGEGPAAEFVAWVRQRDLPDPEAVLRDPAAAPIPARGDAAMAACFAVAAAVERRATAARWEAAWRYFVRVAQAEGHGPDTPAPAAPVLRGCRPAGARVPIEVGRVFGALLREVEEAEA